MPPAIIGAVIAGASAIATAGGIGGVTFLGLSGFSAVLVRVVVSFVVSGLTSTLSPKQKKPSSSSSFSFQSQTRTQQIRQAITSRELIYGEVLKSGTVVFATSTSSNKYLHVVIALADHECDSIDECWLGDDVIPNDALDSNGNVISGKYAGKVRIRKHPGADGQTADSALTNEVSEWSADHRGAGVAYVYLRYEADAKLFPSGAPNASFIVRGKRIFDSRIGNTLWTPNIGLMTYDYHIDSRFGLEIDTVNISESETEAAANACDEIVETQNLDASVSSIDASTNVITLSAAASPLLVFQRGDRVEVVTTGSAPGGLAVSTDYYAIPVQFKGTPRIQLASSLDNAIAGTAIDITSSGSGSHTIRKTGEPRYHGGGVINTEPTLGDNLRDILSGMGGRVTNTGGYWKMFAAVWRAPTVTLDEHDLRAPISVATRVTRADRFNAVKGVYVSPLNNWEASDYPEVKSQTSIDADNGDKMTTDLDLPFTQRHTTAQRIATIKLNLHRQEIVVQYPANFKGIQFQPVDTLSLNNTRMGWSGKAFEVMTWKMVIDGSDSAPMLGTDMVLQETASACYDWNSGQELTVDPAPNTNLPDAFTVGVLVGLAIDSIKVQTQAADNTFRVVATWIQHENSFVLEGGQIQFQYKKSADANWLSIAPALGDATRADLFSGELDTNYDIRGRAVNSSGVPSDWTTLSGFTVGTAGGVTSTEDWGSIADAPTTTQDWGSIADAPTTTIDWGGLTT